MTLPENAIAIVGLAGRFPGAADVAKFWHNARNGISSVTRFSESELEDSFPPEIRGDANFVRARPILENVDRFDADFFGMLPREAALTDPQHRLLLECAWAALEDAGCDSSRFPGAIGVFAGCSIGTYFLTHVLAERLDPHRFASEYQVGAYDALLGTLSDALATRISYKLNLRGPAMTVQSACSTSLLAVAQACQSLLLYQSDLALAGGVSITFPQKRGYMHQDGGMVSPDGICRPFDADAAGTIFGDGIGMVVLKRLADAVEDRDHIYAVIRGSAVNNDGSDKVGFTAPSVSGQADVIASALAAADVEAGSIGYVECHGTATPLGDPIEFAGLVRGFGQHNVERPYCALGSAKANIGHMDVASGIGGLIKAALVLHHQEIPPLANFRAPNRNIDLAGSPFYFPTELTAWPRGGAPRRAGVSSFGVGGTNVHIVLEEAPDVALSRTGQAETMKQRHVLPLSARNDAALSEAAVSLADHLRANSEIAIEDVAHTLQSGRRAFERRVAITCSSREEAIEALRKLPAFRGAEKVSMIFMFPGQGAQFPGMARGLYDAHASFRATVDEGIGIAAPIVGVGLRAQLLDRDAAADNATLFAQPALFIFEYALARLWMSWGIKPDAMVGHSVGEFAAACIAGVFSFEEGCRLVAARAQIIQKMEPGAMLAVRLSEAQLAPELGASLDMAAINAPSLCVVAGPNAEVEALKERLIAKGVACRSLAVSHAFHSRSLDPAVPLVEKAASAVPLAPPTIPFASCVTGDWVDAEQVTAPEYWANHCRAPVRFCDALSTVAKGRRVFVLEVGPGRALSSLAMQIVDGRQLHGGAASLADAETAGLSEALAAIWSSGFEPDWAATTEARGGRIALPTYPFQRSRYWIDRSVNRGGDATPEAVPAPTLRPSPAAIASQDTVMTSPPLPSKAPASRIAPLQAQIVEIMGHLSGISNFDPGANFLELGFDSLMLGQVARGLEKKFGIRITFRQLLKDMPSAAQVAAHLDAELPPEPVQSTPQVAPAAAETVQVPTAPVMAGTSMQSDAFSALAQTQLNAMNALFSEQLRVLRGLTPDNATVPLTPPSPAPLQPSTRAPLAVPTEEAPSRIRLYRPSEAKASNALTNRQRDYVEGLVHELNERTPLSKAQTQRDRAVLADPRTVAGFREEWKELVYPVIARRAKGSKIQDVDGNEYVDLVNGYGQTMFGHSPDFVTAAIAAQLEDGFPIGPQSPLAGEVARLVSEITGNERVTFCNTGSEAVMAAMRVARAVTGRDRVVVFSNDYHGQFDEVLVKGGAKHRALPVAPGIPPESVTNMTVLPYGDPQSLEWIEKNVGDIAAVLVEPVQSRHPELRPKAFLEKLRTITEAGGTALVFDEIVTGFRVHPGGMQAVFGIKADMATYGKVVGGGMPIGILAGKAQFMDALDGGMWRYGDGSVPEVAPTFFAGTFVRHPLVLAAAKAVLLHLKAEGPALQEGLAARMGGLVDRLNHDLQRRGLATRVEGYSSWFYVNFASESALASLFWPQVRQFGVHVQEGYPCFLTTAHSDADIATIENAFIAALDALQAGGILEGLQPADAPATRPTRTAEVSPLTEPQLEILAAAQMSDEASCAFNESISLSFEGQIDPSALQAALNAVIDRHQALRGRVGRDEKMYFAAELDLEFEIRDLSAEADPDAALATLIAADARAPFDLWEGPLVRAFLARLAKDRHALVFTAHHIICDGWSINIILQDLAASYRLSCAANPAPLPAAPGFARYATAQSAAKESTTGDLAYWVSLYRDLPELPDLPVDRPRPALRSYAGSTHSTRVDAGICASLKKAGAARGTTLFTVLFTALQTVLGRLSGSHDIVIGVPVAGQSVNDEPDLVGHCVHMLPFRVPLAWDTAFATHIETVAQSLLDGFDHPKCTYGTLVRALPVQRVANRLPLTEFQFNLERVSEDLDFGGPAVEVTPNAKAAVNFDIFVNIIESAAGLRIDCDYNTDLFDASSIERWMTHYRRVLEGICAEPATPVGALPMLSEDQQKVVLDTVNETTVAYPDACIHDLFAAQASRTPDGVACIDASGALSYAELDRRSTHLAQEILARKQVGGGRIAVATDRSRALLIALLGVMKSGNAYVPLDVNQPIERLRQVAGSARVDGVICQDGLLEAIAPGAFDIRIDRLDLAEPRQAAVLPRVSPDDSAYILFTSGSTGTPKGVEIGHGALTNIISGVAQLCDAAATDVAIASSAITFDVAATELYVPLITGGRVVLAGTQEVKSGFELVALAKKEGATLMQATPTLWRMLLEAGFVSHSRLKMITAGEALPRDLADALLSGGGRLWNLYGPTETAIYSSGYEMRAGEAGVTIGRPVANTQLYILDDRDNVAPLGVFGNLFIGGAGLAKGYFDRSDLTAQSFRTISLAGRAPQRLYRTGDLARLLPTGEFELRGRVDRQVKLRGFRIELEEIENVLRREPSVRDCAVLLRQDVGPDPALVAYVVPAGSGKTEDRVAHLASLLPDYMVPARWVDLESMPLTSSGKVDRNALPVPERAIAAALPAADLPRTSLESRIAAVWAAVIGREDIGIHVPLFALGADSLQLFRIAARLDQEGFAVTARDLMKNPSVVMLAKEIEGKSGDSRNTPSTRGPSLAEFRRGARRPVVAR